MPVFQSVRYIVCLFAMTVLVLPSVATASDVPHHFSAGEPASASAVNENFQALVDAISALQAEVGELKAENAALASRLDSIEASEVFLHEDLLSDLSLYVSVHITSPTDTAVEGPIVRVTGANLQIVNGVEQTTPNGTGNLVVGYAEAREGGVWSGPEVCSLGTVEEEHCTGEWGFAHNSGSHNIVGGRAPAYSQTGGLVVGFSNVVNRHEASVMGGTGNVASGRKASVSGGVENEARGNWSTILGGIYNTIGPYGGYSTIAGGQGNMTIGAASTVAGGRDNTANGAWSSVTGGSENIAGQVYSSVTGGLSNHASGAYSSISGGADCEVSLANGWGAGSTEECAP